MNHLTSDWKYLWRIMLKSGNWDFLKLNPEYFPKNAMEHVKKRSDMRMLRMVKAMSALSRFKAMQ